ncbi:MAG: DUF3459 domain-containing protein [Acidimicrobiia bacterium]|nr:DUF3459 domain-containing protein [Acidimicrobiia bacterium]
MTAPWWKTAVLYQIYPRSFADSDGDGIGDLPGLTAKLPYLGRGGLGVDAVWLSPIYRSTNFDFGYDVSDFCDVDPTLGTLADTDALLAEAHSHGMRVVLDFVPNHTSTEHAWFRESRSRPDSPKRDWYFWRDPRPDGSPPNNWGSSFGGPAWRSDPENTQMYLASFTPEQADVNWRDPGLREAMLDSMSFWLDRGVWGFRLDVADRLAKDPELDDNPLAPGREALTDVMPWLAQEHVGDQNHPDLPRVLRAIRVMAESHCSEPLLLGEMFPDSDADVALYYGTRDEPALHLSFNFNRSLCDIPWDARAFRNIVVRIEDVLPDFAWPCWVMSNHDRSRHATRFDKEGTAPARPKAAATILLTLRGTPVLYYGEEIGMRDVDIPADRQLDPVGKAFPGFGRDPERTPMRWSPEPGVGFTTGTPWLPDGGLVPGLDVQTQADDPESTLNHYRRLIRIRKERPSLQTGTFEAVDGDDGVFAYVRSLGSESTAIAVNMGPEPAPPPARFGRADVLLASPGAACDVPLAPDAYVIADL